MALFRRLFYRKPPDRLLEISERVYVFDCCFSSVVMEEDEYRDYMDTIVAQLQDHYPDASFMVFNFRDGEWKSQVSDILSQYDMKVMDYPRHYEGCPILPLEMIHHFLKSSESWLSVEGQQNVLLMHCERGGWPVLAFMLAGLLLYRKQYTGEHKTLEAVYKQAPKELLHVLSPVNPQASHLRYLQYISRRGGGLEWPLEDAPFTLDCLILREVPNFDGEGGCRPVVRIHGLDPLTPNDRDPKVLFSTPKTKKQVRHYRQADSAPIKINVRCCVQGDVVLECIHMDEDLEHEEMMFRIMFHTTFINSHILLLNLEDVDVVWSAKDQFSKDFKAEVLFSDLDAESDTSTEVAVDEDAMEVASTEEFFEAEEIFSNPEWHEGQRETDIHTVPTINTVYAGSTRLEIPSSDTEVRSRLAFRNSEQVIKDITDAVTTLGTLTGERLHAEDVRKDEITKNMTIFDTIDNRSESQALSGREKGAQDVLDFRDNRKDIVHQELEEKAVSATNNFKHDVKGVVETISFGDTNHMPETQILSAETENRPDDKVPKQHTVATSFQMKHVLDDKRPGLDIPNVNDEMRCSVEADDCERDLENFVDIHEVQPEVLHKESRIDVQMLQPEELSPSILNKIRTCVKDPPSDPGLLEEDRDQHESHGNHKESRAQEIAGHQTRVSRGSDATSGHLRSHSPSETNKLSAVLAISATSQDGVAGEAKDAALLPINVETITSESLSTRPSSPPMLSSGNDVSTAFFKPCPPSVSSPQTEFSATHQLRAVSPYAPPLLQPPPLPPPPPAAAAAAEEA